MVKTSSSSSLLAMQNERTQQPQEEEARVHLELGLVLAPQPVRAVPPAGNVPKRHKKPAKIYTNEELQQMVALGNLVDWNLQKHHRDPRIKEKCDELGISRDQFRTWVHYQKKIGRYPKAGPSEAAASGSASGGQGDPAV